MEVSVSCGYEPVVLDKLHAIIDISLPWVSILSMWRSRCGRGPGGSLGPPVM